LYLINVYLYIKYVVQIEGKKIDEDTLFEICTQTRLLDRLIGQTRLLKRLGHT